MEVTCQVLLFPSQLTCVQPADHALSSALRTCKELSKEDIVGAFNVLLYDAVYV